MKRIISILILIVLFFNWVGYQLYTAVMEQLADKMQIANIDENNYRVSDLISVKVAADHLSSYVHSDNFERVDGVIEIEGVHYNYVKRRVIGDSIELLCMPNQTISQIKTAREAFFKLSNDLQQADHSKKADQHAAGFKCFNGEYYSNSADFLLGDQTAISRKQLVLYLFQIPSVYLNCAGQPPDMA